MNGWLSKTVDYNCLSLGFHQGFQFPPLFKMESTTFEGRLLKLNRKNLISWNILWKNWGMPRPFQFFPQNLCRHLPFGNHISNSSEIISDSFEFETWKAIFHLESITLYHVFRIRLHKICGFTEYYIAALTFRVLT